jgi:flagellar biogenesis protein FliO
MEQICKMKSGGQRFLLCTSRILLLLLPIVLLVFIFLIDSAAIAADENTQGNKISSERSDIPSGQKKKYKNKSGSLQTFSKPLPKTSSSNKTGETSPDSGRSPRSIWVTVTSLGLVLVLIVLGAGLWKKHGPQVKDGLPQEAFQLLGKKSLDQKNSILFFRAGSKILIVSSGLDGMRTLSEIVEPVEVDYLTGICKSSSGEAKLPSPFKAGLNKTLNQESQVRESYPENGLENSVMEETQYRNG